MSSMQSGVSNIYSQASEAASALPAFPLDNMAQVQRDNQEEGKYNNQNMASTFILSQAESNGECSLSDNPDSPLSDEITPY